MSYTQIQSWEHAFNCNDDDVRNKTILHTRQWSRFEACLHGNQLCSRCSRDAFNLQLLICCFISWLTSDIFLETSCTVEELMVGFVIASLSLCCCPSALWRSTSRSTCSRLLWICYKILSWRMLLLWSNGSWCTCLLKNLAVYFVSIF